MRSSARTRVAARTRMEWARSTAARPVRILVPQRMRLRLWLARESLRQTQLRRRHLRLPMAKFALSYGTLRLRLRRRRGKRVGLDRLDRLYVINLETRPERFQEFMYEMNTLGVDAVT